MPSLITFDEALAYGRLTGHDENGALVERAGARHDERLDDRPAAGRCRRG